MSLTGLKPIVLASQSASRAALLTAAGVTFSRRGSDVDEAGLKQGLLADGAGPLQIALALAEAKAVAVSKQTGGLVIGADQTLDLHGVCVDKAEDLAGVRQCLIALRGVSHQLHAALALAEAGRVIWRHVESATLTMRDWSDAFLDDYVDRHGAEVLSSVGCYHLEGAGAQLFDHIEGDYFAILGLPLLPLLAALRRHGGLAA